MHRSIPFPADTPRSRPAGLAVMGQNLILNMNDKVRLPSPLFPLPLPPGMLRPLPDSHTAHTG